MAASKKPQAVLTPAGHKGELMKAMQRLAGRHDLWRIFSDFVEMAACSIANAVDRGNPHRELREARYMEIVKAYKPDELQAFPRMLGHLTEALHVQPGDVLGEVFMELDLGSKWHGQFFTPYEVCRVMAAVTMGDTDKLRAQVEAHGFVTVSEPACGGGAMLIAMAEEMRTAGINYQQHMHATVQDLDLKAVHMAYIQLSLLYVPAYVIHGNTLMLEQRSLWRTPAHVMGGWEWRLRRRDRRQAEDQNLQPQTTPEQPDELPDLRDETPEQLAAMPPTAAWQQAGLF